ncbi:MAG: radical SAM/SPASM domain-containing protein [Promethearchaeota archaeon]
MIETEQVLLKFRGLKLISFKRRGYGEFVGTGLLNPLYDRFRLFRLIIMLLLESSFYKNSPFIGRWKGKRVSNTFAPPVGSHPQLRAFKGLVRNYLLGYSYPVACTFAVTYKCQCKCVHCSAGKHVRRGLEELSTEEAKRVIDESQKLGVTIIAFTGGEPLLRDDIFELIAHVDKKKAMPIMFTNGQFLSEENAQKLVDAGLYSLFVSIDSPVPEEHDKLRGVPGLFNDTIEGIKRMKSKGVFVNLSSYAIRSSTERGMYKKLYQLAKELDLDNFILFDGVPTGAMLKNVDEMLTPEQRQEIYEYSAKLFKETAKPPLSSQSWQNSIEAYLAGIGCLAANIQFYITAYGDIAPCDFTPLSFGNIRKEPLKKIWRRMISHPAYSHRSPVCRMQNPKFRQVYIDPIPEDAKLPYDIKKLPLIDYRKIKLEEKKEIHETIMKQIIT